MLNKFFSWLWINHPRMQAPDAMLTFSALVLVTCIVKVLLNDVTVTIAGKIISCGRIDATVIAAILSPTLAAYYARKKDDPPGPKS